MKHAIYLQSPQAAARPGLLFANLLGYSAAHTLVCRRIPNCSNSSGVRVPFMLDGHLLFLIMLFEIEPISCLLQRKLNNA